MRKRERELRREFPGAAARPPAAVTTPSGFRTANACDRRALANMRRTARKLMNKESRS